MLESNGLKKIITPIFKEKFKSDKSGLTQYVWAKMGSIDVYGRDSNLKHKSAIAKVDWQSTLRVFLEMIKSRGLEISMVGASDVERYIKSYEASGDDDDREARHGVKTGSDEDMDHTLSIPDSEAKRILSEYYKRLFDEGIQIPVRLRPIVNYKDRFKTHDTYYFGFPGENQYFKLRNSEHKVVSGKALTDLLKTIRWMDTFLSLLSELEVAQETASNVKAPATKAELKMAQNVNANLNIYS
ncbi:hypothetical protein JG687_00015625 [Phytophthora cactorum]|uniref:Uncharacterized protein n=1 Tax=Phytophthora cactorum TaxID=29920 RepID=A0A8T1TST5_9STRA|nr:hypothetical protein JG687_00015625 [Phytophthora cactorum]